MISSVATFAAVFAALFAAHSFGDIWVQTHRQACAKGAKTHDGRVACLRHVSTLLLTKVVALVLVILFTGLTLHPVWLIVGLAVDAASHYWADRRFTLQKLATKLGKADFFQLGSGHLGSGAHAMDQSWHIAWLFLAALIISV